MSYSRMNISNQHEFYYNARLDNANAQNNTSPAILANFSDNRPAPLLSSCSNYSMSIVRFSTTLQSIPALLVEPGDPAEGVGTTAYTFTISYDGNDYSETVVWSPESNITPGDGSPYDPYWWCYSYVYFNSLVNEALARASTRAGFPDPPFFKYDTDTATFSLYTPTQFLPASATQAFLYADIQAHYLYSGFPGFASTTPNKEFRYWIKQEPGESIIQVDGADYVVREQIPGSLCNWNPCKSFVFTTQSIPAVQEATNNFGTSTRNQGQNPTQQIITDLIPTVIRGDELRSGQLIYVPSGEYRMISLTSSGDLKKIDWSLWWSDIYGNLHNHILLHNGYVSVKFLFRRKY
jgi:hypothetical protein